jgi:hypothetical protein
VLARGTICWVGWGCARAKVACGRGGVARGRVYGWGVCYRAAWQAMGAQEGVVHMHSFRGIVKEPQREMGWDSGSCCT